MSDVTLTIEIENLTPSQALTIEAMLERWELHGKFGSSRWVSFFVDGDGPFHPTIDIDREGLDVELDDNLRDAVEVGANQYDFDAIWGVGDE